ncbi:MAG TPA: DUF6448 family protein [Terriglobales bacterium]|nr:DUF6448 family protein [Terriglobales bacterium]
MKRNFWATAIVIACAVVLMPCAAVAHCDTLGGPVIADARLALEKGDVTPVLKWVRADDEAEIRQAFKSALAVRKSGPEPRELADRYFFETLVRVHRAGEGAPYTGLKATPPEPIVAASDAALENASSDEVTTMLTKALSAGVRSRAERVIKARKHANENVAAGREYVAAYVDYVHYVENVYAAVARGGSHEHTTGVTAEHTH